MNGCKLSPVGLGLSLGILWGLSLLVLGLLAYHYAYGITFVQSVGTVYMGYEPSIKGSLVGALMGFVHAFVKGFLIAWLYNRFSCCRCCRPQEVVVK